MDSLKKHGDPLEAEIDSDTVRGADVVGNNQPGSKGDGSVTRAGSGARDEDEGNAGEFVRSANQTPNPSQPDNDATMPPGADPDHTRNTM